MYAVLQYAGLTLAVIFLMITITLFIRNKIPETIGYFLNMRKKQFTSLAEENRENEKEATVRLPGEEDDATAILDEEGTTILALKGTDILDSEGTAILELEEEH